MLSRQPAKRLVVHLGEDHRKDGAPAWQPHAVRDEMLQRGPVVICSGPHFDAVAGTVVLDLKRPAGSGQGEVMSGLLMRETHRVIAAAIHSHVVRWPVLSTSVRS